jgi:hypothetical protein
MLRHSTLFHVNSLHVSESFRVHHQEINKINCICNLWYGNSIVRPAVVLAESGTEWLVCCVLCRVRLSGLCVVCCAE